MNRDQQIDRLVAALARLTTCRGMSTTHIVALAAIMEVAQDAQDQANAAPTPPLTLVRDGSGQP